VSAAGRQRAVETCGEAIQGEAVVYRFHHLAAEEVAAAVALVEDGGW
jgi:hypothetical protein